MSLGVVSGIELAFWCSVDRKRGVSIEKQLDSLNSFE